MKEQRTNIFINGNHEYDYVKDMSNGITNHMLFYSKNEIWNECIQETLAASIEDDGDGYIIMGNARPSKKGQIDYHYAQQLEILLRLADLDTPNVYEMSQHPRTEF